jgi:hypothetical protein
VHPFHVTVCGISDAGEFNTKNFQDDLKLNLCLFTAIVIDELEILRYDCLQVREVTSFWINIADSWLAKNYLPHWP